MKEKKTSIREVLRAGKIPTRQTEKNKTKKKKKYSETKQIRKEAATRPHNLMHILSRIHVDQGTGSISRTQPMQPANQLDADPSDQVQIAQQWVGISKDNLENQCWKLRFSPTAY